MLAYLLRAPNLFIGMRSVHQLAVALIDKLGLAQTLVDESEKPARAELLFGNTLRFFLSAERRSEEKFFQVWS
ncbi:hypothetical protein ACXN5S_16245 [Pseudoroseicyclus sp. H15]